MRETSSRSSTSRARWSTWRVRIAQVSRRTAGSGSPPAAPALAAPALAAPAPPSRAAAFLMGLRGLRSSWASIARNSSLRRCSSARASARSRSCPIISCRSVTSETTQTAPSAPPAPSQGFPAGIGSTARRSQRSPQRSSASRSSGSQFRGSATQSATPPSAGSSSRRVRPRRSAAGRPSVGPRAALHRRTTPFLSSRAMPSRMASKVARQPRAAARAASSAIRVRSRARTVASSSGGSALWFR